MWDRTAIGANYTFEVGMLGLHCNPFPANIVLNNWFVPVNASYNRVRVGYESTQCHPAILRRLGDSSLQCWAETLVSQGLKRRTRPQAVHHCVRMTATTRLTLCIQNTQHLPSVLAPRLHD